MNRGVSIGSSIPDAGYPSSIEHRESRIEYRALAVAIIVAGLLAPAYSQTQSVTLMLEQTPVKGGDIAPGPGVYNFQTGSEVILTATAKPGYKFVHWLGDVSDATATSTVVYLNEPKVIIAVFEQSESNALGKEREYLSVGGGGGGGSGLMPTALDLSRPGGMSAGTGGAKPRPIIYSINTGGKVPEVPEPATGAILMLGGLFAFARRRLRRHC